MNINQVLFDRIMGLTYNQLINQVLRMYVDGRLGEALAMLDEQGASVGGNQAQVSNFRFCIAGAMGDSEMAFDVFRGAIEDKGYWYPYDYLFEDDDLGAVRVHPGFEALSLLCREREEAAKRDSEATMTTLGDGDGMLVALHGNEDSAEITRGYWSGCLAKGLKLGLPQSSQPSYWGAYTWEDQTRGREDITALLDDVHVDVLGGFSGGAALALLSVIEGAVSPKMLVLMAPWVPDVDSWEEGIRGLADSGLAVHIVCGEEDGDCPDCSKRLASLMGDAGIDVKIDLVPGLEHDYPIDFTDRLDKMLGAL